MDKKRAMKQKIAIYALFTTQGAGLAMTPAIAGLIANFSTLSYEKAILLTTIPTLLSIPFGIVSGLLAGKKVPFKALLIFGLTLNILGAMVPFLFYDSYNLTMIFRVINGIGVGLTMTLGASLCLSSFQGNEQANVYGKGNSFAMIGGILITMLAGAVCGVAWQNTYIVQGLPVIALILIVLLLEEPPKAETAVNAETQKAEKKPLPLIVYFYCLLVFIGMILIMPQMAYMSITTKQDGLATVATTSLIISIFQIGGMISSFFLGKIFGKFKNKTAIVASLLCMTGLACTSFAPTVFLLFVGNFLGGLGFSILMPSVIVSASAIIDPTQKVATTSTIVVVSRLGSFAYPYFVSLSNSIYHGSWSRAPYFLAMFGFAILAAVYFLLSIKKKKVA